MHKRSDEEIDDAVKKTPSSHSSSPSPSPPSRNLSQRTKFFANHASLAEQAFRTTSVLAKLAFKTPERAEFELAAASDECEDEEEPVSDDDDDDEQENDESDDYSDTDEASSIDSMPKTTDILNEEATNQARGNKEEEESLKNEQKKIYEVFKHIEDDIDQMKSHHKEVSDSKLPRPLSFYYNYSSYPGKPVSTPVADSSIKRSSEFNLSASVQSFGSTVSGSSSSKLKKFNVDVDDTQTRLDEAAEKKRRQELIRIRNEIEKEKTQRIIRELVIPAGCAQTPKKTDMSSRNEAAESPQSLGLLRKSFLCQVCHSAASITERIRLQGLVYHRDCIRCCICRIVVKNAENFTKRNSNDESKILFFYFQHVLVNLLNLTKS